MTEAGQAAAEPHSKRVAAADPHSRQVAAAESHSLRIADRVVAEYRSGERMATQLSPRPHLHPVTSLGGVSLTEVEPEDHPHQHGVSLALADVDEVSYWGGPTFLPGEGYRMLANHGSQRRARITASAGGIREELDWCDQHGRLQLRELREISVRALPDLGGYCLNWASTLTASEREVSIGSPATNGRPSAGYGGIFWRLPNRDGTQLLTADGLGETVAHESNSPWLVINQRDGQNRVGLLLTQPADVARPWFARSGQYAGAGPMLAGTRRVIIRHGDQLKTGMTAVILDRWVTGNADAEQLRQTVESGADVA